MKRAIWLALVLSLPVMLQKVPARAQAGGNGTGSQQKQADPKQQPAAPSSGANPFPEDTTDVPVMPTNDAPAPADTSGAEGVRSPIPAEDADPARSPDDPAPATSEDTSGFSSSLKGLDNVVPSPEPDVPRKNGKKEPTHQEAAAEDVEVGKYYLSNKNWKAALSRFQSAMVLDPENPEVYWGLAEADRHLDNFGDARANFEKLLEYDPDGPHGKEARKAMKDPQIANAQKTQASHP